MAKHHWSIWQKAVFVFLRRKKTQVKASQTDRLICFLCTFSILGSGCDCMSSDEWELSSPMIFVSVEFPPPLSTVLLITSTPIVCVVLTRQRHQLGAFNVCILQCPFWAECRCPVCRAACPCRPLWITLFTDIEDASTSSLWVQSVIRLFMLLKCSKNTSVYVRKNFAFLFLFSAWGECKILTEI